MKQHKMMKKKASHCDDDDDEPSIKQHQIPIPIPIVVVVVVAVVCYRLKMCWGRGISLKNDTQRRRIHFLYFFLLVSCIKVM